MITRHQLREQVIKLLYNVEFMDISTTEAKSSVEDISEDAVLMANNILNDLRSIDTVIENNLQNYSINRLNSVDRAIIRLATYEMMNELTPTNIAINEALELTRDYTDAGDRKAVKFNNKVLDNIAKSLKK